MQDENSKRFATALNAFLPLLVGYFSINLPSGLGLYYFSNILITSSQQIYLRRLGGEPARTSLQMIKSQHWPLCISDFCVGKIPKIGWGR